MYYANDILILENGLHILSKALHPIGITDDSECWGVEIIAAPENKDRPPHLLISTIPPQKWHILFRVAIELRDKAGALAKAATVIGNLGFNIVSTQCAPSGHRHATWHIIVEAERKNPETNQALNESMEFFEPDFSAFHENNLKFREFLTDKLTIPLLMHSKSLELKIIEADEKLGEEGFLHPRFRDTNTLLYTERIQDFLDNSKKHDKALLARIKEHELNKAVTSKWLQEMAIFRCYSQAAQKGESESSIRARWDRPISFKYDSKNSILKPQNENDVESFLQLVNESCGKIGNLPLVATAEYNSEEHYLRIVLPEKKKLEKRISIQLDYKANLDKSSHPSSRGLLIEVANVLKNHQINMNYLSNAITILTQHTEKGVLSIVGTLEGEKEKKEVIKGLEHDLSQIFKTQHFSFEKPTIGDLGAKSIFISTKFEFFEKRKTFQRDVESACRESGFIPVWGDPQYNTDRSEGKLQDLSLYIVQRIQKSQAFLQIIPVTPESQSWLIFELGIALGHNIQSAICVDKDKVKEYPPEVASGWTKFLFTSDAGDQQLIDEIKKAIVCLSGQVYKA